MDKFLNNLEKLYRITFDARSNYEIWWIYISKEGRKSYLKIYRHFKEFFETTGYAHISMITVSLYKLFETIDDTVNFKNIIKQAQELGIITDVDLETLKPTLDKAKNIWIKVNQLRSYLFAHRVKDLTVEEIYDKAKITPNQIRDLTDLSLEILNFIAVKAGKKERKFEDWTIRDTYRLLETLKNSYSE